MSRQTPKPNGPATSWRCERDRRPHPACGADAPERRARAGANALEAGGELCVAGGLGRRGLIRGVGRLIPKILDEKGFGDIMCMLAEGPQLRFHRAAALCE